MKFVDVKNDVAFHKIFGNANKTITLISFLNAVLKLEGAERVSSVVIENPYQFPTVTGGKISVLDISATDQNGKKFIVEMQVANKEGFVKRAQYYATRDYSSQIDSGDDYPKLKPTHLIAILNFTINEEHEKGSYFSHHQTINIDTGEHLLKDVQYFFIELPRFKKKLNELVSLMDKWTFFIKNAPNLDVIPDNVTDDGLRTAYIEADKHNWNKAELKAYDDADIRMADIEQEKLYSEKQGEKRGEEKKEIEMVLKIHDKGKSAEEISDLLDLSLELVTQIIEDHKNK